MSTVLPDTVISGISIKSEPDNSFSNQRTNQCSFDNPDDDDDDIIEDVIARTIDVYISPKLSPTLHLLQFPIQPASSNKQTKFHSSNSPAEARFRPKHCMLELDYPLPKAARGVDRQLPDTMCMTQRTFVSNAIAPMTHMALAKFDKSGTRLDIVPLRNNVLQMRPSFKHLHMHDDEGEDDTEAKVNEAASSTSARQKPILFQKMESERSANARRNSYAYKRASEESEEWIELTVHDRARDGKWTSAKKELMRQVACEDRENELKLFTAASCDGGYVRSLNYLDTVAMARSSNESSFLDNISEWTPSMVAAPPSLYEEDIQLTEPEETIPRQSVGTIDQATAELAAKLAVLLQSGNGTMIPYRVIRSRFNSNKVSDELLTMALSSCAVLVRGNFALKSSLTQFLNVGGTGQSRGNAIRELRDFILLILNMHGSVQRERLIRTFIGHCQDYSNIITADTISSVLRSVAKKSHEGNFWVPKVEDDTVFAGRFPEIASFHGVYWMKMKEIMKKMVENYEIANDDEMEDA